MIVHRTFLCCLLDKGGAEIVLLHLSNYNFKARKL